MEWMEWINCTLRYRVPQENQTDADKYLDFEQWSNGLKTNRSINLEDVQENLTNFISKDFTNNEQTGDGYIRIQGLLKEFSNYLSKKGRDEYNDIIKSIDEINDFIEKKAREMIENTDMADYSTVPESYDAEIKRMRLSINILKQEINKCENEIKNNTTSVMVTNVEILGIFVAIAFALFGIFNLTANAISVINISISQLLFVISALSFILFNLIFLLLYIISRFINKSIAMNCSKTGNSDTPCQKCQNRKRMKWLCKLRHKFTYLFIVNMASILGIIASIVLYLLSLFF